MHSILYCGFVKGVSGARRGAGQVVISVASLLRMLKDSIIAVGMILTFIINMFMWVLDLLLLLPLIKEEN